ncbi:MAG: choice-of-anchor Q domain-containing protein, partial [Bacteroidales bacterium]
IADRAIKDNPTILSGDLDQNDTYSGTGSSLTISNNSGNCYSVVRNDVGIAAVGPTAILDGFVIKGGNADHNSTALLYGGGGMHNNSTNPTIRNCRFEYNSAKYGGAFFSWNSTSAFYNCVFVNNYGYASGSGGAIYNNNGNGLIFNNCDIVNNYSATNGGGISTNNSPANNTSTILNNSIVWGNYSVNSGHQIYCTAGGNITLNYSCYQNEANDVNSGGGTFTNTNNDITTDPKFVDAPNGDFSIAGTSSCLDLGNDTYSTLTTDIRGAGFGRKLLKTDPLTVGTIDIGAYEYKFGTDPATLCTDPSTAGEIAADQTICAGEIPNELTSISEPTGHTGTLEYQWQSNTTSSTFTFDNIIGANSNTFTPASLTTTTWFKRLARVDCMADWSGAVSSNVVMITVEQPQLYVTVTGAGSKNGLSWDNAFDQTQLQAAINQSCGEIWVAKGTYYPLDVTYKYADRYIAFHMKEGVEIYGGFAGTEGSGYDKSLRDFVTNETILSGDIGTPVVNTDNSYHVFYHPSGLGLTSATLIDGFTISGGNADGSDPFNCGGAMYNNNNSPSISNCVFTGNAAAGNGGAIYNTTNVSQTITNSVFNTNTAKNGGAIFSIDNSDVALFSSVVHANQATENGGGAFWMHDACDITLTNSLLYENTSPTWGGGFIILPGANAHVINSTLSQNASGYGGGIYNSGGTLVIDNSILWGNTSSQWGNQIETTNGISTILNNSCFANVYGPTTWDVEGTVINNASITTNPGFINPIVDDFRVQGNSPCINTGNNTYNLETTDIRGQLRIQQTTIDMGAYEWTTGVDPANGDVFVKFNATGSNNGTSWTDAFTSLQSALNLPLLEGDIIWVAKGTYYPSSAYNLTNESRFYHFRMLPGVAMYGSLLGNEDVETFDLNLRDLYTNTTTLSGNIGIEADSTDNAYHVFYHPDGLGLNTLAILDGFKVSEAVANGGGDFNNGGAMFNDNNSPLIRNCNFYKNASADWGGAIYNTNSDPEFNRVSFTHNKATTDGGAVFNNNASSPVFDNCAFSRNSVTYSGGAVYSKESSTPILTNCVIAYNSAMYGGGVFSQSPTQLINCTVSENEAYQGGGLSNEADVTLKNTILWGNRAVDGKQMFVKALTTTDMQYCDYANETGDISGSVTATNSITTFPKFVDKATGDFRIFDNSPSADAGFDAFNALTTDVRGTGFARKLNKVNASEVGTIDMGAYEYNFGIDPVCSMPITAGSIGSAQTICYNTAPGTLTNTLSPTGNIGPLEYKWQLSTTSATEGYTDIASSDSESLVCGTLTVSTWYKRLVRVNCAEDWTNALATDPVKITVYNDFSAGEIETTGETICYNFDPVEIGSTTASGGGDEDITYQWQSSTNEAFTTPSDINTDAVSYDPPSGLTVTTWYRRQAKDATCNTSWTSSTGVWKVTVDPASVGGTITGTITITYGESTGNLVLGGNVGDVLKWQHKVGTESWEDISNTTLTHSESPVSAGTWTYRAEVQSGVCSSTWSDEFVVTVDKKALTTTGATADDKVYDGNTDATITGASLVGIENSDDVSLDDLTGTFASEAFGTHSVTATLTLKGTEKDNYTLT